MTLWSPLLYVILNYYGVIIDTVTLLEPLIDFLGYLRMCYEHIYQFWQFSSLGTLSHSLLVYFLQSIGHDLLIYSMVHDGFLLNLIWMFQIISSISLLDTFVIYDI